MYLLLFLIIHCWGVRLWCSLFSLLKANLLEYSLSVFPFIQDKQAIQLFQVKVSLHQITFLYQTFIHMLFHDLILSFFLSFFHLAFNVWLDKLCIIAQFSQTTCLYYPTTELTVILWQCHFLNAELITVDGWGSELHLLEYCFFFPRVE